MIFYFEIFNNIDIYYILFISVTWATISNLHIDTLSAIWLIFVVTGVIFRVDRVAQKFGIIYHSIVKRG